jgi:hypothetical protein
MLNRTVFMLLLQHSTQSSAVRVKVPEPDCGTRIRMATAKVPFGGTAAGKPEGIAHEQSDVPPITRMG